MSNNNNISADILAGGQAVSSGIYSYYVGKSQVQLAKQNPTAYVEYKKQQTKTMLIVIGVFFGMVLVIGIVALIVVFTQKKDKYEAIHYDDEIAERS